MNSLIELITPVQALEYLIQPHTLCEKKATRIAACILGLFVLPTILGHLCYHGFWKHRLVVPLKRAVEPVTLPDFQNIQDVSSADQIRQYPEVIYWMVQQVGPFKPIGYLELDFARATQEEYKRRHQNEAPTYGPERTAENAQIANELNAKMMVEVAQFTYDNTVWPRATGGPYAYNPEALFALLQKNVDLLRSLPDVQAAVRKDEKARSTELFVAALRSHRVEIPQVLIEAAFGDEQKRRSTVNLPEMGVSQLITLHEQFPHHTWQTIRNFLVYFHRCTKCDPVQAVQQLLSRIPNPVADKHYFVHGSRVYMTDSRNF